LGAKINNQHVDATKRLELLQGKDVIAQCIDARLFGATIPIKGRGGKRKVRIIYRSCTI